MIPPVVGLAHSTTLPWLSRSRDQSWFVVYQFLICHADPRETKVSYFLCALKPSCWGPCGMDWRQTVLSTGSWGPDSIHSFSHEGPRPTDCLKNLLIVWDPWPTSKLCCKLTFRGDANNVWPSSLNCSGPMAWYAVQISRWAHVLRKDTVHLISIGRCGWKCLISSWLVRIRVYCFSCFWLNSLLEY